MDELYVVSWHFVTLLIITTIFGMVSLIAFWQIFKKAGVPAPLSLLMLVPGINLVMLYILAFSPWNTAPVTSIETR